MSDIASLLGQNIRTIRDSLGLTQEKLSEKSDISLKHLGEIERGRGNPTLTTLVTVAYALGVSLSELMDIDPGRKILDTSAIEIRALVEKQDQVTRQQMLRVLKAMVADD